jgi:hypothetical protein
MHIDSIWYAGVFLLVHFIDLDIDKPSLHSFLIDAFNLYKGEINKDICTKIHKAYLQSTCFEPRELISPKLQHYKDFYLWPCSDGLMQPLRCTKL